MLVLGATTFAAQSPAGAADDCFNGDGSEVCCAGPVWEVDYPSGFRGTKVTLRSNCMIVYSTLSFKVDHYSEIRLNRFSSFFVKAGITIGRQPDGGYLNNATRFWSENKGAGYFAHYFGYATLGSPLVASMLAPSTSSNDWDVWFDNVVNHDVSANNFTGPARYTYAGVALTDGNDETRTVGNTSRLYYYNLGGAITPRWQGSSSGAGLALNGVGNYVHWASASYQFWWAQMGRNSC